MNYAGAVYALQIGDSVKIGFTQNLRSRLKAYGYGSGRAKLVALVDCPDSEIQRIRPLRIERQWHSQAAPYRTHGEWYHARPELLSWLASQGIDANLLTAVSD